MDSRKKQYKIEEKVVEKINKPLTLQYNDAKKLYLEDGFAYKKANEMRHIKSHQLRKVLNSIKEASTIVKNDSTRFEDAKNILFYIVPMTAYNAGREKSVRPLYDFVSSHINENTITKIDDIKMLDKLFTSIVAYHKLLNPKN